MLIVGNISQKWHVTSLWLPRPHQNSECCILNLYQLIEPCYLGHLNWDQSTTSSSSDQYWASFGLTDIFVVGDPRIEDSKVSDWFWFVGWIGCWVSPRNVSQMALGIWCWILGTGYSVLVRYWLVLCWVLTNWVLATGYWSLGIGHLVLGTGYWSLDIGTQCVSGCKIGWC